MCETQVEWFYTSFVSLWDARSASKWRSGLAKMMRYRPHAAIFQSGDFQPPWRRVSKQIIQAPSGEEEDATRVFSSKERG